MARAIWSGSISFGLVTIPVKLTGAVHSNELSFHMLHKKDEGRIKFERICSVDGKPVPWDEIVKGYEYEKGEHVVLTDADFERIDPEVTHTIDILEFVELEKIDPMYFDQPYYLEPTKQGRHAYALLRETLEQTARVAVARVVIRTKEYIAAVKPSGSALVLDLMRWSTEIVDRSELDLPGREKLPPAELKMAKMLVDSMSVEEFEPAKFPNRYRETVLALIEARVSGKELPKAKKAAPVRGKVVNLMDVLERSLKERGERKESASRRKRGAA
ncbi:MAG TPA: Ku protein [Candidatus Dormibacteraeota bacterium]|nr:Ku protein [Candidatus Dormibacteraeota bacterium]